MNTSREELLPLVYEELRKLATHRMANEARGHTLQPTALVHEAWLRSSRSERAKKADLALAPPRTGGTLARGNCLPRATESAEFIARMMHQLLHIRRSAWFIPCLVLLATVASPALLCGQPTVKSSPDTLCVMTYNLRFASPNPPNAWPQRRPLMRELIQNISPDVMGTQEGVYEQLKDLESDLPDYEWLGLGRDGGSRGEFMAVFYRKTRLEPLAFDHFWLSDTPDVIGSKTWGPSLPRMVTWIKFRDRQTRQEFYFFNTHFDHQVQPAREKSAELVRKRIAELDTKLPVLLVGDFNAAAGTNKAFKILTEGDFFKGTWQTARERHGEGIATFNSFKALQKSGVRIDWILSHGDVTAEQIEIVTFERDGQFPSDHFPVVARLLVGGTK